MFVAVRFSDEVFLDFQARLRGTDLASPPHVVDDRELDQGREDERGAGAHPDVDGLRRSRLGISDGLSSRRPSQATEQSMSQCKSNPIE